MPEINLSIQEFDPDATETTELKPFVREGSHIENRQSKQVTGTVSLVDIKEKRFSSLLKLLRVTTWVRHFVNKLQRKDMVSDALTAQEIQSAKHIWDRYIQEKHYSDVIEGLKKGKGNNMAGQLNLQLDDNYLLRCHGRYDNPNLNAETRCPKLLPRNEYFTYLVIKDYHERLYHAGASHTLAQTRTEYWIPQG